MAARSLYKHSSDAHSIVTGCHTTCSLSLHPYSHPSVQHCLEEDDTVWPKLKRGEGKVRPCWCMAEGAVTTSCCRGPRGPPLPILQAHFGVLRFWRISNKC